MWYLIVSIPDLCTITYFYKIFNSSPKPVPAASTEISCRLQVPGRGNQQQPIFQQPHSECNYLCKVSKGAKIRNRYNQVPHLTQDTNGSVHWLPQEKHKVQKSSIKGNGIQNSCSPISGVFIVSLESLHQ